MDYDMQEKTGGIDINLFAFLRVAAKKIWIVILLALVFGIASRGISSFTRVDTYTTVTSFVVNTADQNSEKVDNSDISASINVTSTYKYILEGRSMILEILSKCTYQNIQYGEILSSMMVNILPGSNVIEVRIRTDNPDKTYAIARALVENYNGVVSNIYSSAHLNICDYPYLPTAPDESTTSFVVAAVGAAAGAILGFIIILIYYFIKNTVRSVEDIPRKLGIDVLGSVNRIKNKPKGLLITNKKIGFSYIETFKAIRTKVENNSAKEGNKVYMVTSACENEGKTTVSTNLAITLAQNGKSVLLIDSDLRKPAVCKMLGIENTGKGLADVISIKVPLSSAIKYVDKYKIFVIADTHTTDSPSELLSTKKMAEIIKAVRSEFDYVIIDTAPASVVTDATVISALADATILVISEDVAPVERIRMTINDIDANGAEVIGCIYNNSSVARKRYSGGRYGSYGSYGYGYGYDYGYGYGYGNDYSAAPTVEETNKKQ